MRLHFLEVFKRAGLAVLEMRTSSPAAFWLVLIINLAIDVLLVFLYVRNIKPVWKFLNPIGKLLYLLVCGLKLLMIPVISVFIVLSGEAQLDIADLMDRQFYLEVIAATVLAFLGFFWLNSLSEKYPIPSEDEEAEPDEDLELMKQGIKGVVLIVLSLIFMFTSFENRITDWGFKLFSRKLGAWMFDFYCAWAEIVFLRALEYILSSLHYLTLIPRLKKNRKV